METLQQYIRIARLICKKKFMPLTEQEKQELLLWQEADSQHQRDYKSVEQVHLDRLTEVYRQVDSDKEWEAFRKRLRRSKLLHFMKVGKIAASVCLLLGVASLLFFHFYSEPVPSPSVLPEKGVRLILSTGESLNLSSEKKENLHKIAGKAVLNKRELKYVGDTVQTVIPEMNTLLIPKGAFYHLILADGTKVWLNADTKITYPVQFTGSNREVTLSGEAYFDVVKDPKHPFIVKTDNFNVSVLGTSFNVNTYGDNGKVYAALQEGIVELSGGVENTLILAPGQVAELDIRNPGALLKIADLSLEQQIAWKEGFFCFRHTSLFEIFRQVERYYDIQFANTEQVENEYYTGDISRNVSLQALLAAISAQTVDINFQIVGKVVYIIKKRD